MTPRTYGSPEAFKQALEQRLRSSATGTELTRRRQLVVFDRFLARIVSVLGDAATLKGGLVLELRLGRARTTKDVDLRVVGSPDSFLAKLQEAGRMNLHDFMAFEIRPDDDHPEIQNDGMKYDGLRFRAECKLAGKIYGKSFGVDIAFGDPILGEPEVVVANNVLAFAGIAPPTLRIYPIETHLAEKLHAYTMPRARPNSRVKDLPDFALLASAQQLDAKRLRAALEQTFAFRNTHPLPGSLPAPIEEWRHPYEAMARENQLPWTTLDEITAAAKALLDPVLAGRFDATWHPIEWRWSHALTRGAEMASSPREESFTTFFRAATGGFTPYRWQLQVALAGLPDVLPVPTGLGKTEVALAWAWRLLVDKQPEPLHLVMCMPMRSLVSQTVQRLRTSFEALKSSSPELDVAVHQLMGGAIDDEWVAQPDRPWVLVGTQDQLLSRALNRGYSMSRFEWPAHFGLLNNDCRWLIDEVQLMGPGLWTTSQLDWMRRKRFPSLKPCLTTWMSATVGTSFLRTTDRVREALSEPSQGQLAFEDELETALDGDPGLTWWRQAKRPLAWWQPDASSPAPGGGQKRGTARPATVTPDVIAASVKAKHVARTLTLVICNTVDMAREVFRALPSIDHKVLLTSRFRREDRARHEQRLIDFDAKRKNGSLPKDDPGLICVSTQVIEAGVDISAHRLFTELAPWPSMLQRLGRLNRKGDDQEAHAWVWETPKEGGNKKPERIGPYEAADLELAKKLVSTFAPLSQERAFSEAITELTANKQREVAEALQPKPSPLPRALDVHGLFSTERDVHGGFTDVSAFVRGTDPDLDATVFWRDWSGDSPPRGHDLDGPLLEPAKEGCPVSFVRVQKMLESSKAKAWQWDDEADRWERVNHWDLRPGMLVMLKREVGGYDVVEGWTGDRSNVLAEVPRVGRGGTLQDDAWTELGYWSKLEDHLKDARREAEKLCDALSLTGDLQKAVVESSGLHDLGKAHPQWQARLPDRSGIPDALLAKSPRVVAIDVTGDASRVRSEFTRLRPKAHALPDKARRRGREDVVCLRWAIDDKLSEAELKSLRAVTGVRQAGHAQFRPGLRHEVASALAMWRKYRHSDTKPYPALAVYLAATHHGKARTVMRSTTGEGDDVFGVRSEPSLLVIGGDQWPLDFSIAKDGAEGRWEGNEFVLTGSGWTGLVADLLGPWRPEEKSDAGAVPEGEPRHLGPFALAYLEALVRIADWRASAQPSASTRPSEVHDGH